ncbi:hypothetical protein V5799_017969 [Amblyomma americanum]|uniref:Peptidase M13 N-terminal domain-containing protein n=1 Tax=Amblyomma americanum TaxID=6943 RepID=A0AAQ4F1L1_AMBAM
MQAVAQAGAHGVEVGDAAGGHVQDAMPEPPALDLLEINVLAMAWIWGLLPGALTGGVVTYYLWSTVADVGVIKECTSSDCRVAAELLRTTLDRSVKPCDDFYTYVCASFKGPEINILYTVTAYMHNVTEAMLYTIEVPPSRQNALQKATGLYRACVNMVVTNRSEISSLKKFLALVGLDMSDMSASPRFSTVESIVRLSFEYGLPAIVRFEVFLVAWHPKKAVKMEIDENYMDWLESNPDLKLYEVYLAEYDSNLNSTVTGRIITAERTVGLFINSLPPRSGENANKKFTTVGGLDALTQQIVPKGEWARLIGKYTDNAFGASDVVLVMRNSTEVIKLLVASGGMDPYDTRLLLSWSLLHRLLPLASGHVMKMSHDHFEKECFKTVFGVMEMALMNTYLRHSVPPASVTKATEMSYNLMRALAKKIADTAWIQGPVRRMSLEKAFGMRLLIAYPEVLANTTKMEAFFGD